VTLPVQSRLATSRAKLELHPNMLTRVKRWAPWLLMAVVVALMVQLVDVRATLAAFDDLEPIAIALTVGLYLLDRFTMAHKWNILLRARGCWLSHWAAFRLYLASGFVGYVIPASIGSDVFRAARLSVAGRSTSNVSATIVLERVLGLLAILTLSSVSLLVVVLGGRNDLLPLLGGVLAILFAGTVLTAMSMSERLYCVLRRATNRFAGNRIVKMLHALHDDYVALSKSVRPPLVFFALSIVNQLIQALMCVPVLVSLGAEVDLLALFAVLPLSKAFIQLMPVPAGIGVAEGSQVVALSLAHVAPAQGLAVALVLRAIDLSMLVPAGVAYAADAWHMRKVA
jgi:glycosyltransferase 2 family protein